MSIAEFLLSLAGFLSVAIAVGHIVMIPVGVRAYRYFDAGDWMIRKAEAGSVVPAIGTLCAAFVFGAFGVYALSGAGWLPRAPALPAGLVLISAIYVARGLVAIPQAIQLVRGSGSVPVRELVFSLVSAFVGGVYAVGTAAAWSRLC